MTDQLDLVEIKPGTRFSRATLQDLLPDVETLLFFGKVYDLDYAQLSSLMKDCLQSDLAHELLSGAHSTDLQGYIVDLCAGVPRVQAGDVVLKPDVPHGEILPHMWEMLEVEVAKSIKDVASKLESVVDKLPGKQGRMVFQSMMKMNAKRPTLGDYKASIHHTQNQQDNLLILDVSGSMTDSTVRRIIEDVVALSYKANAHMAVVSNTTTHWEPGTYDVAEVLSRCEFGGTYYETLGELLARDWGTVITVADYDSSYSAKDYCAQAGGHIDQVLDISLVNRPTFLAECVGQLADDVRPLLIAAGTRPSQLR